MIPLLAGDDDIQSHVKEENACTTSSLEELQTEEQKQVLDIVAQIRKCGLEGVLSLPQIVVCGDQSAGKSSVLEALTEIPFPRNDNLCTRFATEIILRRALVDKISVRVIPAPNRSSEEQEAVKGFEESITNFDDLPKIMEKAMTVMGINNGPSGESETQAFAKDVLSLEIEGPLRPQLTLVDLPGLFANKTLQTSESDSVLVAEITDYYISQQRTICLPVISALNDYANQKILTKVRAVDPEGDRTLGIITKPDRLEIDSGSEKAFIGLARNEDIFFKLGWHVLRNRNFKERDRSFVERNAAETEWFRASNFNVLSHDSLGIDPLRKRLSMLLFHHVKQELPKLREDLEVALLDSKRQLECLGGRRQSRQECKSYLIQLGLDVYEICKGAVNGHYEGDWFNQIERHSSLDKDSSIRCRLRAAIQAENMRFSKAMRIEAHKYHFEDKSRSGANVPVEIKDATSDYGLKLRRGNMSRYQAKSWVSKALLRSRGRELPGNYNPLVVGELFWEQASNWYAMAVFHAEKISLACDNFLDVLLNDKCTKDLRAKVWSSFVRDSMKSRHESAMRELDRIMEDLKSYPINYNHYYTDTVQNLRRERMKKSLQGSLDANIPQWDGENWEHETSGIVDEYFRDMEPNMENFSCDEALDCLRAIYKVSYPYSHKSIIL